MKTNKKNTQKKVEELATQAIAEVKKTKKVKTTDKVKETPKEKVLKEAKKQTKSNLLEEVVSNREVKYKYPEDVVDTLSRKKFRQECRNKLRKLEREMNRIEDKQSKEYLKAKKAFESYTKEVTKPEAKIA